MNEEKYKQEKARFERMEHILDNIRYIDNIFGEYGPHDRSNFFDRIIKGKGHEISMMSYNDKELKEDLYKLLKEYRVRYKEELDNMCP